MAEQGDCAMCDGSFWEEERKKEDTSGFRYTMLNPQRSSFSQIIIAQWHLKTKAWGNSEALDWGKEA